MNRMQVMSAITVASVVALLASNAAAAGGKGKGAKSNDDYPVVLAGGSCETAIQSYVDDYDNKKKGDPPDLSAADYGAVLNQGTYLAACDVPSDMALDLCVAVQNGHAVGVTVKTTPSNETVATCVATQLRGLEYASAPRMDVARTHFAPEKPAHESASSTGDPPPSPASPAPPPVPPSTGCGCGSTSSGGHAAIVAALALAMLFPVRRMVRGA